MIIRIIHSFIVILGLLGLVGLSGLVGLLGILGLLGLLALLGCGHGCFRCISYILPTSTQKTKRFILYPTKTNEKYQYMTMYMSPVGRTYDWLCYVCVYMCVCIYVCFF